MNRLLKLKLSSYFESCAAEGLVDALQVVWQEAQQAGGQEDSSCETADQTQRPAPRICNTNIRSKHRCSLITGGPPGPDSSPESTQHGPAPRTMHSGANPNSNVMDSRTTSAPSLISSPGMSAGLTCSAVVSLPAGRRPEEEEPPMPLIKSFHL